MISGVVLSGGQSKRLGREKGLALLAGTPLVSHVARAVADQVDEVLISVAKGKAANYRDAVADDVRIVEDRLPHAGPVGGLISALTAAKGDYVLVAPCDTPLLKARICGVVLETALGRDGAVPIVNGFYEPLHAAYRRETGLRAFKKSLSGGKSRVSDAYSLMSLAKIDEATLLRIDPSLESFWNINTEEDLVEAEKRLKFASH